MLDFLFCGPSACSVVMVLNSEIRQHNEWEWYLGGWSKFGGVKSMLRSENHAIRERIKKFLSSNVASCNKNSVKNNLNEKNKQSQFGLAEYIHTNILSHDNILRAKPNRSTNLVGRSVSFCRFTIRRSTTIAKKMGAPLAEKSPKLVVDSVVEKTKKDKKSKKRSKESRDAAPVASVGDAPAVVPVVVEDEAEAKRRRKEAKRERKRAALAQESKTNSPTEEASPPASFDGNAAAADAYRKEHSIAVKTASKDAPMIPAPITSFSSAPFSSSIREKLTSAGFTSPSPIQAQAWPLAVAGADVIAVAKTGSGKTLAFLLPFFHNLDKNVGLTTGQKIISGLVLAPTRELAVQIEKEVAKFASSTTKSAIVYGGVPKQSQITSLKAGVDLLVATPGRLVDLIENDKCVDLSHIKYLVLDEADRMLDMGFQPQMDKIRKLLPSSSPTEGTKNRRQTLLFSATWPKSLQKLAATYLSSSSDLSSPIYHITVGDAGDELAANRAVSQVFYPLSDDEKDNKLWGLLDKLQPHEKAIVFANTKRRIENLSKAVLQSGYNCAVMSGDKTQQERDHALKQFATGKCPLLFATDVCARGLDIAGVTHVFNYDMARDVESYIHRIGRTGRAGGTGTSITFVNEDYDIPCAPALAKIAREAGQEVPAFLEKLVARSEREGKKDKLWKY